MPSERPRVLVLSPEKTDSVTVCQRLGAQPAQNSDVNYTLSIDNKYYSVTVELCAQAISEAQALSADRALEAIILVVPHSQFCVRNDAKRIVEFLESREDIEIRLLLADHGPECKECSQWTDETRAWCVEHMMEYCETCVHDAACDDALGDEDEREGFWRVKEALQAHMWNGMVVKGEESHHHAGEAGGTARDNDTTSHEEQQTSQQLDQLEELEGLFNELSAFTGSAGSMSQQEKAEQAGKLVLDMMRRFGLDDGTADGSSDHDGSSEDGHSFGKWHGGADAPSFQ